MAGSAKFRSYSRNMLWSLIIGYVANLLLVVVLAVLLFNGNASENVQNWLTALVYVGLLLFIAQAIFVLIYDCYGALTLRGCGQSQLSRELMASFLSLCLIGYLFFPEIMLPIYLVRIASDRRQEEERKRFARRKQIAMMESRLGILPPTSGTCRVCHKPLQVGAEFCQYCGAAVIERPRVCPSCAETALPDARWCPHCGSRLAV